MGLWDRIKKAVSYDSVEEKEVIEKKDPSLRDDYQSMRTDQEEAFDRPITYEEGLAKSRNTFTRRFKELMASFRYEDEDFFEELEDLLIESDVGFEATMEIADIMRHEAKVENIKTVKDAERVLIQTMVEMYEATSPDHVELKVNPKGPTVLLFVGVNGVGKTTTIAKLAHQLIKEGNKVLLAAGDTFRAGAIEQLQVWGKRVGADVVASKQGADPSSVVFDALKLAKERQYDYLLVDTAGRLQNKKNLMMELEKKNRVIQREIPDAPHETIIVLDATTGQNALIQAKQFREITAVTGIALTKMDGTAKGGIVLAIGKELGIPVKFVGLGEGMEDLRRFEIERFAYGLFKDLIS
ncbi:signal recognition particle-docking protein FtsY [Allofustis seminis]|uniref:signal recognition particle-docking protein FtsY n=1 Tax=Allofustis seminis TaxID=166939 RepID=UPI00037155A3|nr:signal recognition particle-docking protein FtsY [Allofustis seminis]